MKVMKFSAIAAAAVALMVADVAQAQDFPSKTVEILAASNPATPVDLVARAVAEAMSGNLGQPVIVQNVPGAGGTLAMSKLALSPKDGYTLGAIATNYAISAAIYNTPYDPAEDIDVVSVLTLGKLALAVRKDLPVETLADFLDYRKANPVKYGSAGVGSTMHLTYEMFNGETGAQDRHIPYKGSNQVVQALSSGEIDSAMLSLSQMGPLLQADRVRALAIASDSRDTLISDVPTMQESGVDMNLKSFIVLLAPTGVPEEVMEQLNASAREALASEKTKETLAAAGFEVAAEDLATSRDTVLTAVRLYEDVVSALGIQKQ